MATTTRPPRPPRPVWPPVVPRLVRRRTWRQLMAGGRWRRVVLAGLPGLAATLGALALAVVPAAVTGPRWPDAAGLALLVAGLALVAVALRAALRGRRRLVQLGAGLLALTALAQWAVVPAVTAGFATSAARDPVAAAATLGLPGARDVRFRAMDGVELAGWYVPGTTGAAVVVLHGSHGTRAAAAAHVRLLATAGHAVLAVDARGHGESAGAANALGWAGVADVGGAVRFLRTQPGVDPGRIAALGLSMGAEEALRAAADGVELAAVVADGAGASTLGDQRLVVHGVTRPVALSVAWLSMRAVELTAGRDEPPALADVVGRIRVPVLLVASRASGERALGDAFATRIGARASLWYVADAPHTGALRTDPDAYRQRVLPFLRATLHTR